MKAKSYLSSLMVIKTCSSMLVVGLLLFGGVAFAGNSKVTVCHYPLGNLENPQTITVSENAVNPHLKHGDTVGECGTTCELDPTLCDDGNLCTDDVCLDDGTCEHFAIDCDDGNLCTQDLCDAGTGCLNQPNNGVSCDDGNACTENDECFASACTGVNIPDCCLADLDCDDGDLCTVDQCTDYICTNLPPDCSLTSDQCVVGFCDPVTGDCASAPVSCDDGNVCTDDFCDSITGCYSIPTNDPPQDVETSCADGADNDCDGYVDLDDTDCEASCPCFTVEELALFPAPWPAPGTSTWYCKYDRIEHYTNVDHTLYSDYVYVAPTGGPANYRAIAEKRTTPNGTTSWCAFFGYDVGGTWVNRDLVVSEEVYAQCKQMVYDFIVSVGGPFPYDPLGGPLSCVTGEVWDP